MFSVELSFLLIYYNSVSFIISYYLFSWLTYFALAQESYFFFGGVAPRERFLKPSLTPDCCPHTPMTNSQNIRRVTGVIVDVTWRKFGRMCNTTLDSLCEILIDIFVDFWN